MQQHPFGPLAPVSTLTLGGGGRVFQQMVDGIAAEDLDPLALHDLGNSFANLHRLRSLCIGVVAMKLGPTPRGGNGRRGTHHSATVASILAIRSGGSGPASAAATHSASSWRFFTPSTKVSISSDSA
jgi:hypothetical protein